MITQTVIRRYPGKRIEGYRNSSPRVVKVLAVGQSARQIVEEINQEHRDNIVMSGGVDPDRRLPMDEPVNGLKPDAVVVVHQQGEPTAFPFAIERTASMLSFIVLETNGMLREQAESKKVRDLRSIADLFVTTSDSGFVKELVSNLAS